MASLKFLAVFAILLVCCSMLSAAQDMDMDDQSGIRVKRQWGWGGRGGWGGWGNRGFGGWGNRGWGGGWGRGGYGGYGWGR